MKKLFGFCGVVLSSLLFTSVVHADQNFVDFDDYLINAATMTGAGISAPTTPLGSSGGTAYLVQNPAAGVVLVSTPIVYFRADGSSYLSAESIVSSATIPSQTFTDGQAGTGTLTVVSYLGLSTAAATGQFTAVSTSAAAGAAASGIVVFGTNVSGTQVAINGPPGNPNYIIGGTVALGFVSSNTAANFATAVNVSSWTLGITALQSGTASTVLLTCINVGTACNSFAVTSTTPTAVSTAAFAGGTNPVTVTLAGANFVAGINFQVGTSTPTLASNLAAAIAASSNTVGVTAGTSTAIGFTGTVFTTATVAGTIGNIYGMATSNPLAISTSAVFMTGGQNNATVSINGVTFTANQAGAFGFYPVTSTAQTATNLALAISNNFALVGATATASGSIVSTTATLVGVATNYPLAVSTSAITPSIFVSSNAATGAQVGVMAGGLNASYALVNGIATVITIPNHGFNTGLPVLYSSAAAVVITGLTNGTTYYPIVLTPNTISIASSTAQAMLGNALPLTSSQTKVTADTFTLAPLAITGTPSWQFVVSNDAINWLPFTTTSNNITIASSTYSSYISTGAVGIFDLSHMDYIWVGAKVFPPTTGALNFKLKLLGKTQ